ncbi:hypothetical protein [Methylocystis sp. S23]|jgi:hypothetical protein
MPYPDLPRAFFAGAAVILLQFALGAALVAFTREPYWIAGLFLLGVPLGVLATRSARGLAFPAMCLFALTGVAPVFFVHVPLHGDVVNLRRVDEIPAGSRIAGYVAPGWRIELDRATQERLTASRGKGYGYRRIAPLVGDGWTPAQPVEVWVMGETRDSGRVVPWHPKFWREPGGEYVRLVGADISGAQLQAQRAAAQFGLRTAEEALIVMRVDSIAAALKDQYLALARALAYPLGAWAAMIGLAALYDWRRTRLYL